jgi:hypothetical protein
MQQQIPLLLVLPLAPYQAIQPSNSTTKSTPNTLAILRKITAGNDSFFPPTLPPFIVVVVVIIFSSLFSLSKKAFRDLRRTDR